jgi:hypothetical protein
VTGTDQIMGQRSEDTRPSSGLIATDISPTPLQSMSSRSPAGRLRSSGWRVAGIVLRPATLLLLGLVVGALIPLNWLTSGPSLCPFKVMTGLPCPGCGLTRSTVAFLHGDITTSFYFHPLGAPMVIALVVFALIDAWVWWRGSQPGGRRRPASWLPEWLILTPGPWVAIAAITLVWLVRLPLYLVGAWTF